MGPHLGKQSEAGNRIIRSTKSTTHTTVQDQNLTFQSEVGKVYVYFFLTWIIFPVFSFLTSVEISQKSLVTQIIHERHVSPDLVGLTVQANIPDLRSNTVKNILEPGATRKWDMWSPQLRHSLFFPLTYPSSYPTLNRLLNNRKSRLDPRIMKESWNSLYPFGNMGCRGCRGNLGRTQCREVKPDMCEPTAQPQHGPH